jgi:hypothetical protein
MSVAISLSSCYSIIPTNSFHLTVDELIGQHEARNILQYGHDKYHHGRSTRFILPRLVSRIPSDHVKRLDEVVSDITESNGCIRG